MDKDLKTSDMKFDYIDKVSIYTGNELRNKNRKAMDAHKVLGAFMQTKENLNIIIRQLNIYDASNIMMGEKNWMMRNHFSKYMPSRGKANKVQMGQVCIVDYGKTYKGEIGYIHPGLCIGKKENKYLVIPMTTGKNWRSTCYHPTNNPEQTKQYRQSCVSEGFSKDGVLLMSDMKFISGGRIFDLLEVINATALKSIQMQAMGIAFPNWVNSYNELQLKYEKMGKQLENAKKQINNLKSKCEEYNKKSENMPIELE